MTADNLNIEAIYPLTPVQDGILFHTLYAPEAPLYIQQYTCRIEGTLDVDLFQQSWQQVVDRHPALRSLFTWEGREKPLQIVRRRVAPDWRVEDWRGATEPVASRLGAFLEHDRARGFQLDVAPLMRFAVFVTADEEAEFVWTHHHIIVDGWSMGIVLDEVFTVYEALLCGEAPVLPAPPPPFQSYVGWLRRQESASAEAYWRDRLGDVDAATPIGIMPQKKTSPWAARHGEMVARLPADATARLAGFARRNGLTLNTVLQGAWALLLHRYGGEDDVVFGTTFSGRPPDLPGSLEMVGLFINTLPVRVRVAHDESLLDWLRALQRHQVESAVHESTPLVDVQGWSRVPRGEPLFHSLLVFENVPAPSSSSGLLDIADVRYLQRSNYPLALLVMPGEELEVIFLYDADRFPADLISRMSRQLFHVLEAMSEAPDAAPVEVPLFPEAELREILDEWNDTAARYPADRTIHSLIEDAVRRAPDAIAVVGSGQTLTYGELDERAEQLASELRRHGVGPNVRAAISLDRSPATVVAIVGVLKAGGAYVPVDPGLPAARLDYVLTDTAAAAVITDAKPGDGSPAVPHVVLDVAGRLAEPGGAGREARRGEQAAPDDLAYVIYTSGSTGRPKGVEVTHRNLVNSTHARVHAYGDRIDAFLLLSPFFFDSSVAGLFSTLTQGGTIVLPAPQMEQDVGHLADLIAAHRISHTLALPRLYELLLEHADPTRLESLRLVMVAGEACAPDLGRRHHTLLPEARLVNEYGPTETTVWCTAQEVGPDGPDTDRVPIGRPIANTQTYILDARGRPVPVGAAGELHVGGLGVARGYLGDSEMTAERFVTTTLADDPIRLYRTGDVARYLADGTIDLIGRADTQVKIRGQRVELGEIERVLESHPAVRQAVVSLRDRGGVAEVLVAHVATDAGSAELRDFLVSQLPAPMVPTAIVTMATLPHGPTGKVDRQALEQLALEPERTTAEYAAPATDTEKRLAGIWSAVLGVDGVGIADNFFELGGDSILSIRIIARAHAAGLRITPRQFFDHPTVAELAVLAEADAANPER